MEATAATRRIRTTEIKIFSDYEYDLQNQRYFKTLAEKKSYMNGLKTIYSYSKLSYIREDSVKLSIVYDKAIEGKYIEYKNEYENRVYYAQVIRVEFIDTKTTKFHFLIDWTNTLDLNVAFNLYENTANSVIDREHVRNIEDAKGLHSSVDGGTDLTVGHESLIFDDYYVFIQSTVSLNGEYGDVDKPKVVAAKGQVFDKLPSGQTTYVIKLDKFQGLLNDLKESTWIIKNFNNITLIPMDMISEEDLEKETGHDNLYSLNNGGESKNLKFKDISFTTEELRERFGLNADGSEDELLRYPHSYIEIVDYAGGYMLIDPAFLPKNGMIVNGITSLGSINQLDIYIDEYKNEWHDGDLLNGEFLGTSLTLTNFPLLPVQIDNYQLALASTANSRKVANEKMVYNSAMSMASVTKTGLESAVSGGSMWSVNSTGALGYVDAMANFYFQTQEQLASYEDKKISPVSLTTQSTNFGNLIANRMFGIHVRFKQNQKIALERVKGDFCYFGFPTKRIGRLETPIKMSVVDFVKTSAINFNGKYVPKVAVSTLEQTFSLGVHFWHTEPTSDIYENVRINL